MSARGLSGTPGRTYSRLVGTSGTQAQAPAGANVRLSRLAIDALQDLPKDQAAAVAGAIRHIGPGSGSPLKIRSPGNPGEPYFAIVPNDDAAPVVIYRKLGPAEGGGYLVTALTGRNEFGGYERAERQGILDSPAGKLLIAFAVAAAAAPRGSRPPVS